MIYDRRYIQYNDLVFDGYDMISDADGDISFKGSSTEYSFRHGSYRPFKNSYLYVSEREVGMTLTFNMRKLPCEYRNYYLRFAMEQLSKPGKLWSIKNGELYWAYAATENISETFDYRRDVTGVDVSFTIPGGIWYKADKERTFLLPWDVCLFMECKGYKTLQPCSGIADENGCCEICEDKKYEKAIGDCHCCCIDELTPDMALCYHKDLESFYGCDVRYQVVYDCQHAEKFSKDDHIGQKLCTEDICEDSVIAGQFYSETEIPTEDVDIIIRGKMVNPWIKINGNTNIIKGEYDGTLYIHSNGDVYYQKDECCEPELLDPSVWIVPKPNDYGWTVNPQVNSIVVYLNACCSDTRACVWVDHKAIAM